MRWVGTALVAALVLALSAGCDAGTRPDDVIDRETFIATYLDLRRAALRSSSGELDDAARERVLAEHGVTEEDLLAFTEAHGRDVEYMMELWSEVERRMDSISAPPPAPST